MRGAFSFTIAESPQNSPLAVTGDSTASTSPGEPSALTRDSAVTVSPVNGVALGPPMNIARWLGFLALFSVIGAVAFRFAILERVARLFAVDDPFIQIASVGAATYGVFAAVALIIATVITLYGESLAMRDVPPEAIVFATGWGWAWLAQMLACIIAIVGFAIAHRGARNGWSLAAVAAIVFALPLPE